MKKLLALLILTSLILSGCGAEQQTGKVVETIRNDVTVYDRASSLIDDAYEANTEHNVIVSPLSLNTGLGLLSEGANGDTKSELLNYLGSESYTNEISSYINKINSTDSIVMANSVWVNKNRELVDTYKSLAKSSYKADINNVSFESAYLDNTVKDINNWCRDKTNGLITKIISRDNLSKDTSSVLVNSLYFKSSWVEEFNVVKSKFKDINGKETLTDMLTGNVKYYYENEYAKGFAKDYENGIKFIGILPNEEKDFRVADLDLDTFFDYKTDAYDVIVTMPKLSFDYTMTNVINNLKKEGVATVFDGVKSNLSGMIKVTNGETVYVNDIIQRCKINLDEYGTEAAAVTAIITDTNSIPVESNKKTKKIDLNRPFVFVIYDEEAEQMLFVGKVVTIE